MLTRHCALVLFCIACTKPNPKSCLDEFCEDPALPFCDVDGSFSGLPGTPRNTPPVTTGASISPELSPLKTVETH